MKNIINSRSLVIAATWMGTIAGLHAVEFKPKADNPNHALVQKLSTRLDAQMARLDQYETLHQEYHSSDARHAFLIQLEQGIEIVTESHAIHGTFTQKDYFLHESKVYAHRVLHHEPAPDDKMERVVESYFLFDADGNPIYRSQVVTRVPAGEEAPDLSKVKGQEMPLPAGLEGWSNKLTARAFGIARTFRPGIGRYTFGDWDVRLLKNPPPEEQEELEPSDRPDDWLPGPETLVLPVEDSSSPDGLFEIGWGYAKGPVDWASLANNEGEESRKPYPTFDTELGMSLPEELQNDGNFLMNGVTGKSLIKLHSDYPGESRRFNYHELNAHWSPSSSCFVVTVHQKWFTECAEIGWIKNGVCDGTYDVIKALQREAETAVKKSKHPAAARLKKKDDDERGYSLTISEILVEDNGQFEAHVTGEIPRDDESIPYEVIIEGTFSPGEKDGSAKLKTTKVKVLPPIR